MSEIEARQERIEVAVEKHGEQYRKLIQDASSWLVHRQPLWGLDEPINEEHFIRDIVNSVTMEVRMKEAKLFREIERSITEKYPKTFAEMRLQVRKGPENQIRLHEYVISIPEQEWVLDVLLTDHLQVEWLEEQIRASIADPEVTKTWVGDWTYSERQGVMERYGWA